MLSSEAHVGEGSEDRPSGPRVGHGVRDQPRIVGTLAPVGLLILAIAFRAWAVLGGWFQFDDIVFLTRVNHHPLTWGLVFQGYGGHLLPLGFLLTWFFGHTGSLDFLPYALTLLLLQAVAFVGAWYLLRTLFGRSRAVPALLCLYVFTAISVPGYIWWAAGAQQIGLQIALTWGLAFHVRYLRTRGMLSLVLSALAMVFGLACYEKTLLVYGAFLIIALTHFATGSIGRRLVHILREYWLALLVHGLTAVAYLVLYVCLAFNFGDNTGKHYPVLSLAGNLLGRTLIPGFAGGPLSWRELSGSFLLSNPSPVFVLVTCLALAGFVWHNDYVTQRSRRGWLIPIWFAFADLALIGTARAAVLGPVVGLELRNVTEMGLAFAIGVGLATLPVMGAESESAVRVDASPFLDSREWLLIATAAVSVLGLVSSYQYASHWRKSDAPHVYFENAARTLGSKLHPTPLINISVPQYIMWGYEYPQNTTKYVLRTYRRRMRFPQVRADSIYVIGDDGKVVPAAITPEIQAYQPLKPCAYKSTNGSIAYVPLQHLVKGPDWWVRFSYLATKRTRASIHFGDSSVRQLTLPKGLHNVFFHADGPAGMFQVTAEQGKVCVNDADVGVAVAAGGGNG